MQPVSLFSSLPTEFCTVISGVFIFVGSQFALKGILEPAQELKVKIAEIGKHLDLLTRQPWAVQENNSIISGNTDSLTQEGRSAADRNNDIREGNLEKRRYEGSRRKSWYRDRRVKRAWNSRGPHDASRCLLRHLHPFDTIPPRHRRAPSLSQRPGRLSSNDNPTIATTPSDHYTCTNPYLC